METGPDVKGIGSAEHIMPKYPIGLPSAKASPEESIGIRSAKILYPLFVGQGFGVLLTALTFIVVARLLGPSSYGIYTFAFGFSTLVNGFLAFGIGAYFSSIISRLAYKKDGEGILRSLTGGYMIEGAVGTLLTVLGISISGYVAGAFPHVGATPMILITVSGTIIALMLNSIATSALIGFSRTGLAAILSVSVDIIQLVLSIVLTIKFGVLGAVSAMLIGYVFGAIFGLYLVYIAASRYCRFRIVVPPRAELRGIFSFVWPIAATNFLNTGMQNFSIIFLGLCVSAATLGNYGAAAKALALITMIHSAFGSGLFPIFSTAKAMSKEQELNKIYNMIIHFALLPMLPFVLFVGVMAGPGLGLLVGQSFNTAPLYLTLIAVGTTIGLFVLYISNLLISGGYTKSVMKVNLVSAVFQLLFLLILVPSAKVFGTIVTIFFIGNVIEAILFERNAKSLYGIRLEFKKLGLLYLANVVFGVALAGLLLVNMQFLNFGYASINRIAYIIIGLAESIVIYPPILVILGAVTEGDIISMKHAAAGLGRVNSLFMPFLEYAQFLHRLFIRASA